MSIFVWALLLSQAAPAAAPGNVVVPAASRFRLVRSTSGDHGTQDRDRFVFENPRSVFHAGADRQVLVLFEWQGPLGPHHCEGIWKDPGGRAVLTSQSDLVARAPRFGVYWGLTLPDAVATGTWVLEARIDGEPAGAHAFQVVASPPGSQDKPARARGSRWKTASLQPSAKAWCSRGGTRRSSSS